MGTPSYMPPEQATGEPDLDARVDLYSLGMILYECLTGRLPYTARAPTALMIEIHARARHPRLVRPEVPSALDAAVMKAIAPDRTLRFGDALDAALPRGPRAPRRRRRAHHLPRASHRRFAGRRARERARAGLRAQGLRCCRVRALSHATNDAGRVLFQPPPARCSRGPSRSSRPRSHRCFCPSASPASTPSRAPACSPWWWCSSLIDPHNTAAVLRTFDALGIGEVHLIEHGVRPLMAQSITKGCERWIDLYMHRDSARCAKG